MESGIARAPALLRTADDASATITALCPCQREATWACVAGGCFFCAEGFEILAVNTQRPNGDFVVAEIYGLDVS